MPIRTGQVLDFGSYGDGSGCAIEEVGDGVCCLGGADCRG